MAVVTKIITQNAEIPVSLLCDRCGRSAPLITQPDNQVSIEETLEAKEFLRLDFIGGFSSIFGDDSHVQGDFCQHCIKELLGPWLRIKPCAV